MQTIEDAGDYRCSRLHTFIMTSFTPPPPPPTHTLERSNVKCIVKLLKIDLNPPATNKFILPSS